MPSRDCENAGPDFLNSLEYLSRRKRATGRMVDSEAPGKVTR